jgi:hypothetical protein
MSALNDVIVALRKIDNQEDLNTIASEWKRQMTYIGRQATSGLKKGDVITWEYRGVVKTGTITKMNKKTTEVVNAGASPFGRTITKIHNSMITGKVQAA